MKTVNWRREPKGPGSKAEHMFCDAQGERIEILVYDCPPHGKPGDAWAHDRMCGFEIFGRRRPGGPFHEQLAAGETSDIDEARRAAFQMIERPREEWEILPRSWFKPI